MVRRGPRQHLLSSDLRPAKFEESASWGIIGTPIRTTYPCCDGPARLQVIRDIPKQVYDRRCSDCGTKWTVTRTTSSDKPPIRIDRITWETPRVEIWATHRKALLAQGV